MDRLDERGEWGAADPARQVQPRNITDAEEIELLKDEVQAQAWDLEVRYRAMQDTLGELEESRKRYADLYDYAPAGYVTFDEKGCISEINLAGAALLGMERSRVLGMPMSGFLEKGSYKLFFDHLRSCRLSGNKVISELKLAPKNAAVIDTQITSMPLPGADGYGSEYRSNIVDISERKLIEKEMSRMERLNLIGQMAAGIAHEIRNPMTTVRGFLQTFMRRNEYAQIHSQLGLMVTELDRANSIITEYLALARDRTLALSPHSLNEIIASLLPLMESDALLQQKWIVAELSAGLPALLLDLQEMRQLILNFVRNGLEAMLSGQRLTIGTFAEGDQVVLFIQDQGMGIPPEVLAKLGTPFLTTKESGTGLGLPICYSIAHRHNAKINVKTGDSGTTFFVRFPRP